MHYTQNLFNTSCACIESVPFVSPSLRIKQRPLYASLYWTMYCISLQSAQRYATDSSIATWIDNFAGVAIDLTHSQYTHTRLYLFSCIIYTLTHIAFLYICTYCTWKHRSNMWIHTHIHRRCVCIYKHRYGSLSCVVGIPREFTWKIYKHQVQVNPV